MAKTKSTKGSTATAVADPVAILEMQLTAERQEKLEREAEALESYLDLVGRQKLTPGEAESLAYAARDLGYSPSQIREDQQIIRQAQEALGQHDNLAELHQKLMDARAAYQSFLERIDLEEQVLAARLDHASRQHRLAVDVGKGDGKLEQLARHRPELFDRSTHPPRLRVSTK